jgi:putative selenate reductase
MRHLRVQSFEEQLRWILTELRENGSLFGIPRSLFHRPDPRAPYVSRLFGETLQTPVGPAAGPHTQLARNIVAAWLSGARFIELKTVQINDELEIPRPCIDMADEGYNVEWSQELRLEESAREYVAAWTLVHLLPRILGFDTEPGTIFNMSVGYDLRGILQPRMRRFMDTLGDASSLIEEHRSVIRRLLPEQADAEIPSRVTGSCTLSTMHGCPPDEIGRIASYLLEERGLNLSVKLNPTLLGKETLLGILHEDLGFREISIPDRVFEQDLKYPRAVELIRELQEKAGRRGLFFGVKLTNTLAMENHRKVLPGEEMYLSGRALYPISLQVFRRLFEEFGEDLRVSFSAGADAVNLPDLFACGADTVTLASDLLKPGGTSRILQGLENLSARMEEKRAQSLEEFASDRREALPRIAEAARSDRRYSKEAAPGDPRVSSPLGAFDCLVAPCMEACPVRQEVPCYAARIAEGDPDGALRAVLRRNPLPGVTGHVCTHACQEKCTRAQYDEPVAIRALKRFAAGRGRAGLRIPASPGGFRVAVVGAGPSGLAAASVLGANGVETTLYEARERPGGMMSLAPEFRLPREVLEADVDRIRALGVRIETNCPVKGAPERLLERGFDAVYLACGFPGDAPLSLEGTEGLRTDGDRRIRGALELLAAVSRGERPDLGKHPLVIGGGNTAMDGARTAARLCGGPVTVVYRRTRGEMPASEEEIRLLLDEGNELIELAAPARVLHSEGRMTGLECGRNALGEPDASGRRRPVPTGERFILEGTSLILAIGQSPSTILFRDSRLVPPRDGRPRIDTRGFTGIPGVYAGGDLTRGPETVIAACADGRRAAEAICSALGVPLPAEEPLPPLTEEEVDRVKLRRARKVPAHREPLLPRSDRTGFEPTDLPLDEAAARSEAERCLQCADLCDKCVEVCPNRANVSYRIVPTDATAPVLECRKDGAVPVGAERIRIVQARQVLHVEDFCNGCGNCATFCVHPGKPYEEKPRVFLDETDFLARGAEEARGADAKEKRSGTGPTDAGSAPNESARTLHPTDSGLRWFEDGSPRSLTRERGGWIYEDPELKVSLFADFGIRDIETKAPFEGRRSLAEAFRMATLYRGIRKSASFLLPHGSDGSRD